MFLKDPIGDGGQWDMMCNIINKYGLMPKKCFPESFSSESSMRMNAILKSVVCTSYVLFNLQISAIHDHVPHEILCMGGVYIFLF